MFIYSQVVMWPRKRTSFIYLQCQKKSRTAVSVSYQWTTNSRPQQSLAHKVPSLCKIMTLAKQSTWNLHEMWKSYPTRKCWKLWNSIQRYSSIVYSISVVNDKISLTTEMNDLFAGAVMIIQHYQHHLNPFNMLRLFVNTRDLEFWPVYCTLTCGIIVTSSDNVQRLIHAYARLKVFLCFELILTY